LFQKTEYRHLKNDSAYSISPIIKFTLGLTVLIPLYSKYNNGSDVITHGGIFCLYMFLMESYEYVSICRVHLSMPLQTTQ
jgi:hypothetical protein